MIPALQPLVNLARLSRRAGDPEGAYRELEAINEAVGNGGRVTIHGEHIDFDGLALDRSSAIDSWLSEVMREDGTRALVAAGQWANAAAHAEKYDKANQRLREARQMRVIAHTLSGQIGTALDLIYNTMAADYWEHSVAACLRGYVLLKSQTQIRE